MDQRLNSSHEGERKTRKSGAQSGQAIVIIALMMVSLLGITGLALDGGSLLLLQRRVQKVADLAALAASVAKCGGGDNSAATLAARNAALANEVATDAVQVKFDADTNTGQTGDIEVEISLPKNPYFIQVVYRGPMNAQASSITRCSTSEGTADGYLMYAMSSVCGLTLQVTGSNSYLGGTLISNHEMWLNSGSGRVTGEVKHVAPITYVSRYGPWDPQRVGIANYDIGRGGLVPASENSMIDVIQMDEPEDTPALFNIEDFRPGGIYQQQYGSDYHILKPAYGSPWMNPDRPDDNQREWYQWGAYPGSPQYIPREGIIYVPGDFGGTPSGQFQDGNFESVGDGLTIVMEGAMNFSGGGKMSIQAFTDGLAIFSNKFNTPGAHSTNHDNHCNQSLTHMGSGVGAEFEGIIYAPGGFAHITTDYTESFRGSIVANRISIHVDQAHLEFEGDTAPAPDPSIYYVQ